MFRRTVHGMCTAAPVMVLSMTMIAGGVTSAFAADTGAARPADVGRAAAGPSEQSVGTSGTAPAADQTGRTLRSGTSGEGGWNTALAAGGSVAYVSQTGGEPWGMPGNVHALDDVFGAGNWDRLDFPTAVGNGLFDYDFIFMDGGDGADAEFTDFVNTYRPDLEVWVEQGGCLLINAARYGGDVLDLGFGVVLVQSATYTGTAVDASHPVFDGPYGNTGANFEGDYLAHDYVSGGGITSLMKGDDHGYSILAEKNYGSGHVMFGGLTLPFFGEHELWSANCGPMLRNLLAYASEACVDQETKYEQPFSCDQYVYFSNVNSDYYPYNWLRYDDFICTQTGDIDKIVFWGCGWDVANFQGCDLFQNLEAVRIDIYEWAQGGECEWQNGPLLCSNTIPVDQLDPVFECVGPNGTEDYYRFTADLPEPCYQKEGQHYALLIAGVLRDTNSPCIFGWTATAGLYGDPAYSYRPDDGVYLCGGPDMAFELLTVVDEGDCVIDQNQPSDPVCMAAFNQTDLAQSFKQDHDSICGAGIKFTTSGNGGPVTIEVWDALPNAGGNLLASGNGGGMPGQWLDVFWPTIGITAGQTYYLVFYDNGTSGLCVAGDTSNPYPDGIVYANPGYQPFPGYDYTFRTYYEVGGVNPCPWDFDEDGDVDTADLLHLLGAWGTPNGDVDGDGDTDTADLLSLLAHWGECP